MATYTLYIVSRNANHHYPVLMANNGKKMLNEPVKRARTLIDSFNNLGFAFHYDDVAVVQITEKEFRAKFPKFARNAGPKKRSPSTRG